MDLLSGLMFGVLFGFLLQRAHVLRYEKQINLLRLKDMTVLKFMLTAGFTGMVVYQLFESTLFISLPSRPVLLAPMLIGGVIFGLGWAIVGYCPGTQLGALGEGRLDAFWAFLGAVAGATLYVYLYPWVRDRLLPVGYFESLDLDVILGLNPWLVILILGVVITLLFLWLERRKL